MWHPLFILTRIIHPIWRVCVASVGRSLNNVKQRKGDHNHTYQRLLVLLDVLRHFFNADGNGLDYSQMDNEEYEVWGG